MIVHGSRTDEENPNKSASSAIGNFSKASFVPNETGNDVDVDDPDFWNKVCVLLL